MSVKVWLIPVLVPSFILAYPHHYPHCMLLASCERHNRNDTLCQKQVETSPLDRV